LLNAVPTALPACGFEIKGNGQLMQIADFLKVNIKIEAI